MEAKCGRTQPLLTGFQFRGDALKGCSAGGWRSGRRRSEGSWRRGHFQPLLWVFRACRLSLEQLACQRKSFLEGRMNSICDKETKPEKPQRGARREFFSRQTISREMGTPKEVEPSHC